MDFQQFWDLFQPDEQFEGRFGACERVWADCSPAKQEAIIAWLKTHGRYKGRNPYFFIQDFKARQVRGEPTNYNGRALPDEPTATAFYNGKWGTYTLEDIKKFNLKTMTNEQ